jgi:hypothetical protein
LIRLYQTHDYWVGWWLYILTRKGKVMEAMCKVCVTGASGYIASLLINKLLAKGYTVHATLRDLSEYTFISIHMHLFCVVNLILNLLPPPTNKALQITHFTEDESKVELLKSFPQSQDKLVLFQADIYNSIDFEAAIKGCEYVFHVATPLIHEPASQVKLYPCVWISSCIWIGLTQYLRNWLIRKEMSLFITIFLLNVRLCPIESGPMDF